MPMHGAHFTKDQKIAIIGAGPAGVHMASQLKKRGYSNVTVLEKTGRVGGKAYSHMIDGIPHELGTCFLHNGYHRIKDLVKEYGLRNDIAPMGRAVFLDEAAGEAASLEFDEFVDGVVYHDWQGRHLRWKWLPESLVKTTLLKAIWDYDRLYIRLFGTSQLPYAMPLRLSDQVLEEIDMTFLELLQQNGLEALVGLLKIAQAAQGYGYLEDIPAYYGLCWITPELLNGLVKQSIGLTHITRMLPDGYETLWRTMAEKDALSIRFNTDIHRIERQTPEAEVSIDCTDSDGVRRQEVYDFLILTMNLRDALALVNADETESRLFGALKGFTLTTTLYESDPFPGYSTADYDKAIAYFPDVLAPGRDNEWYADRNDRHIFAEVNGVSKRFDRQVRVAYQFSEEEFPEDADRVPPFRRNAEVAAKLEDSWASRGVGNPQIIEQFSWPYFLHFPGPAIRKGYIQELFEYQGQNKTWYAGGSASFESVNHVVNYNHALLDEYL
jgi:hypothetical protein